MRALPLVVALCTFVGALAVPISGPSSAAVPGLSFTQTGCEGYSDSVARLYTAGLARTPEQGGFAFWIDEYTKGRRNLRSMASFFTQSTEFTTRYGTLDEEGFIRLLYRNVLGREGEAGGIAFWTQQLNGRTMDRGTVLLRFAESPENIARSGTSQPILGPFNEGLSGPWTCAPALKTDCTPTISRSPWQVGAVMGPEWLLPEVPYPHLWVQADLSLYSDCGADRLLSTGAKAHLVTNGGQLRVGGEYLDLGVSLPCRMDYSGGPPREVTGVTGYSLDASVAPASIANIQPTEAECRAHRRAWPVQHCRHPRAGERQVQARHLLANLGQLLCPHPWCRLVELVAPRHRRLPGEHPSAHSTGGRPTTSNHLGNE